MSFSKLSLAIVLVLAALGGQRDSPVRARTAVLVTELEGSRLGARRGEIQATRLGGDERPG